MSIQKSKNGILGLDWGERYIGVAIAWQDCKGASPYEVVERKNNKLPKRLGDIIEEEGIATAVVGLPQSLDGSETEITKKVREFGKKLGEKYNIAIEYQDERWSSLEAERAASKKPERNDDLAAQIILQSYLDSKNI